MEKDIPKKLLVTPKDDGIDLIMKQLEDLRNQSALFKGPTKGNRT